MSSPSFFAAATVWVHQLLWYPAPVTIVSAFCCRASAMMYSSFRALFPPNASPVRSSLFMYICGPSSFLVRRGRCWMGVGSVAMFALGYWVNFMGLGCVLRV